MKMQMLKSIRRCHWLPRRRHAAGSQRRHTRTSEAGKFNAVRIHRRPPPANN